MMVYQKIYVPLQSQSATNRFILTLAKVYNYFDTTKPYKKNLIRLWQKLRQSTKF